ncbi:DUF262 domain-containing protein [Streptomyces sp. MBT65]|uniref:DUF262 domain-containing protein n=1 Tax=Streptomyces sp. MBT65 TaxID=1488395 RepID=UPI00190A6D95|nr:DUF262 domain-containing protein [Streptomyces sp. MBT65]MBK3581062.1 DUF262 domain-containing protein [Streptomyces sp. MBT65]
MMWLWLAACRASLRARARSRRLGSSSKRYGLTRKENREVGVVRQRVDLYTLPHLVRMVEEGRFRVGAFSRPAIWGHRQITELFDSVHRGFPIGTITVAEQPAGEEDFRIAGLPVHASRDGQAWTVLDGVQRLTTLVGVWHHQPDQGDDRYAVWYDLDNDRFLPGPHPGALPVSVACRADRLRSWIDTHPFLTEDNIAECWRLHTALTSYQEPVTVLSGIESSESFSLLFTRLNDAGVGLARSDVARARKEAGIPTSPVAGEQPLIRQSEQLGFGRLPEALAVQCLLAVAQPRRRIPRSAPRPHMDELAVSATREAVERAGPALEVALRFVRKHARIPHVRLLPHPEILPVLVRFVSVFGPPSQRPQELLRRWVWRTAMLTPRQTSVLEEAMEPVAGTAESEAARLLESVPPPGPRPFTADLTSVTADHPEGRLNALGLLSAGPALLVPSAFVAGDQPGAPLSVSSLLTPWLDSEHDLFCRLTPQPPGASRPTTLGNYLLHPPAPSGKLLKTVTSPDSLTASLLEGHFLDPRGIQLLSSRRYEEFVQHRDGLLKTAITHRAQSFARWGFKDRGRLPSLPDSARDTPNGTP